MEGASLVVKMDSREICVMIVSQFIDIWFIAIIIHCLSNVYCKSCQIWLQHAERDIMVQTVLAPAPQTAKLVKPLTVHVAVMLVGWGLTVALVFLSLMNVFLLIFNKHQKKKKSRM